MLSRAAREEIRRANDAMVARWGLEKGYELPPKASTVTDELLACVDRLTERQHDVVVLAAKGLSDGEIGGQLGISRFSVCDHMKAVFRHLGVTSRIEAAVILAKCGAL